MIKPYHFTVEEFMTMVDAGLFHDQKVELLDGTIVDMTPASPRHEFVIDRLVEKSYEVFFRTLARSQSKCH